jgi:hypothetical protein
MAFCYYCSEEINELNKSKEHIIHNFLGGNISSYNLLCKACNNKIGSTIDAIFYNQFKPFTDLVVSKNSNNKTKVELYNAKGKKIVVGEKLIPFYKLNVVDGDKERQVFFKTEKEFDKHIEKIKSKNNPDNEIAKKYIEPVSKEPVFFQNSMSKGIGNIGFGGPEYHKAILKIALNYYLSKNFPISHVSEAIDVFKGLSGNTRLSFFYYSRHYSTHELTDNEVSNVLYLKGNSIEKTLICYVELLNLECLIVKLNMNYLGPDIDETYCYDVLKMNSLKKEVTIKLNRYHLEDLHVLKGTDLHELKLKRLSKIIENLQE